MNEIKPDQKDYYEIEEKILKRLEERRVTHAMSQVVFMKRDTNEPTQVYDSQAPYIFLQYIHLVLRWGSRKAGISERRLRLLMYLYPMGPFNGYQFKLMCKTISMYQQAELSILKKAGLIKTWREGKGRGHSKLYCLTHKGRVICSRMHKMCLGEEKIPMTDNNPLKGSELRIDRYYLDMMKIMNKGIDKKAEEESNPRG